jgi:exodeoxyribonuclease VII large subunit
MVTAANPAMTPKIWQVGALCRAIADALEARFNPVAVRGEVSGFSRASSGHCYFSLKDENGQIRCAMFRRAAGLLDFTPRDGELVDVRGRLGVYEPRGDLQLIVESMSRAGQGALFEQFLRLKAKLEGEGLFDPARKRSLAVMPRGIGVVTSLGAAALHDVMTALRRRVPHIPVVIAPAAVQGAQAAGELVTALSKLYQPQVQGVPIDVILLVRGGGSMDDLWSFNDERLARAIVQSPVPLICGVGHETDFTIADFCADLRAPTPTAAAELVAQPRDVWLGALDLVAQRLNDAALTHMDRQGQRLDQAASRLGRPSGLVARQQLRLSQHAQQLRYGVRSGVLAHRTRQDDIRQRLDAATRHAVQAAATRLDRARLRLDLLDPRLVLQRGYAMLQDSDGKPVTQAAQTHVGQALRATLADGEVDLGVLPARLI